MSADEGSVELLAALVYSPSKLAGSFPMAGGTGTASLCLDGPGELPNPGVGDPESSLGIRATLGPSGVGVSLNACPARLGSHERGRGRQGGRGHKGDVRSFRDN